MNYHISHPRQGFCAVLFSAGILLAYLISSHVHPFRTFYNELAPVIALLLALGCEVFLRRSAIPNPGVIWIPFSLILMITLQVALGMVQAQRVTFPLMYLFLFALSIFFGYLMAEHENTLNTAMNLIAGVHLLAALVSVGMELIQVYGIDARPWVMFMGEVSASAIRPFANVAQPNQLALLLCFGLASCWWLFQARLLRASVCYIFALMLTLGLVLTQSRIAWIILPLFALFSVSGVSGERRCSILAVFSLLAWYWLLLLNLATLAGWLGFSGASVFERLGGHSERTILAQQAIAIALEHPWLGAGWFRFCEEQVRIGSAFAPTIYAEHSHNLVLNIAAELGIPFAIAFFGTLVFWFWKLLRNRQVRRSSVFGFGVLFLGATAVHSMVEFPLWYAFVLLPLGFFIGALHRLAVPMARYALSTGLFRLWVPISLLCTALVVIDYQKVVAGFAVFRMPAGAQKLHAKELVAPRWTLFNDYFDYFEVLRIVPREGMSAEEISLVEQQSHRFGFVHILSKLAEIYALNQRPQEACKVMKTLRQLHPFYYPEYDTYWHSLADADARYKAVVACMAASE